MPSLFACPPPGLRTRELGPGSEAVLQRFFEANPLFFIANSGEPPKPEDAFEEIHGELPEGWSYTKKRVIGFARESGDLAAMASVVSDLLAKDVWHITTFIVETARDGNGDAASLYKAIESWARAHGAHWLRLGVVKGHAAAERFWQKCGYQQTRQRPGAVFAQTVQTMRVMCKPLTGRPISDYLALVERDRPQSNAA